MTTFVYCYWQHAQPQPLARAVQTAGAGGAGMVLGGRACDVPMGRTAGDARGGRVVVACAVQAVTHFNPY